MKLVVRSGEREEQVEVRHTAEGYEISLGSHTYRLDAVHLGQGVRSLRLDGDGRRGEHHEVAVHPAPGRGALEGHYRVSLNATLPPTEVEVMDPLTHLARESRGGEGAHAGEQVRALMPGRVVAVLAEEGTEVEAGQGVVVIEAMKMENEIAAEHAGVVSRLHVEPGQAVEGGEPLFDLE